ncbi:MAG TPA: hypothetical protein VMI11_13050 [Actinomycetes bacterium]|nr:hypothetical protein [Actinomycetes bacterium]
MRKQYHFWPGASGRAYDAWDVDRLIELTRGFPVVDAALDSIWELDVDYWSESGSGATPRVLVTHMRLVEEVDPAYPIILGPDGRVMDGMHRVCRALLEGRTTIAAVRFDALPTPDYRDVQPDDLPY